MTAFLTRPNIKLGWSQHRLNPIIGRADAQTVLSRGG